MKTAFVSAALLGTLMSVPALAQVPAPTPRPQTPGTGLAPTAQPGTTVAAPPIAEPTLPTVDDPMLAPPPPPTRVLGSWREAIDLARRQSTSLRTAAARVDEAAAQARQVLGLALPQLTGGAGVSRELLRGTRSDLGITTVPGMPNQFVTTSTTREVPDPSTDLNASLGLRIPVFAPAAWYNHGTAKDITDLSRLNAKETERLVVRDIADAMVATITAERLAEVTRVSLASALSTVDLNKRRAALGASSQLDVLRAEQLVQDARANVVTADETLRRAREALGTAFGSFDAYSVKADIPLETLASDARTYCAQEKDLDKRPDVVAANANVKIAERRKEGVDWTFWPTIDAVSGLGASNTVFRNNEHVSWTIGAELSWLLYDGGIRYGQREEAEAASRIAREQLTDTRQRANTEVVQSQRAVQVATVNLGVFTRSREIAAETARLAKIAYINGSGTSFDLVDTAGRLRQAEIDLTVREFELLRARIAAYLALASCNV